MVSFGGSLHTAPSIVLRLSHDTEIQLSGSIDTSRHRQGLTHTRPLFLRRARWPAREIDTPGVARRSSTMKVRFLARNPVWRKDALGDDAQPRRDQVSPIDPCLANRQSALLDRSADSFPLRMGHAVVHPLAAFHPCRSTALVLSSPGPHHPRGDPALSMSPVRFASRVLHHVRSLAFLNGTPKQRTSSFVVSSHPLVRALFPVRSCLGAPVRRPFYRLGRCHDALAGIFPPGFP